MYFLHSTNEESFSTDIFLKEHDVLFGRKSRGTRFLSGTRRFREILKEKFDVHSNADQDERRKIEKAVILQLKNELPPDARFLRIIRSPGIYVPDSFRLMSDKEVRKATGRAFNDKRHAQKRKEKQAVEKANSSTRLFCDEPPTSRIVLVNTPNSSSTDPTPRVDQENAPRRSGQDNDSSTKHPIKETSNLRPPLKESKATPKIQEPTADANNLVDENATKETIIKRPIEITFPYGSCSLFFPRRDRH